MHVYDFGKSPRPRPGGLRLDLGLVVSRVMESSPGFQRHFIATNISPRTRCFIGGGGGDYERKISPLTFFAFALP